MRLLLASRSVTRRAMLEAAGVLFECVSADLDEEAMKRELRDQGLSAAAVAEGLAEAKAKAAAGGSGDLVLGSDQTLELEDGLMLDKPRSPEEALDQLRAMRGRTHRLHSAAAVVEEKVTRWSEIETVALRMRDFSDSFLHDYVMREYEHVRWSVGGYRIEGLGVQLFDRIDGSHFAILGLPLLPLLAYLRERGVIAR